jgi:hypothetical protein
MRIAFLLSLGLCLPAFAWAKTPVPPAVDIRIAVVLAKEKRPEGATPEMFSEERRREHKHACEGERKGERKRACEGECKGERKHECEKPESCEKGSECKQLKEGAAKESAVKESTAKEGDQLESEELRPMQRALGLRRHYGWLKRFSKKRASIDAKGEEVELPGGAKARVRLQELKDDVATLVVSLPSTETVYQLGRTGSLYLQAGKHEDTEVWVVISPAKQFRSK